MDSKGKYFTNNEVIIENNSNWGVWGKEKYTLNDTQQNAKHLKEKSIFRKITANIPERLRKAMIYTYGLCDLEAYSSPITEAEFEYLSGIYEEAEDYTSEIKDKGIKLLLKEFYYIQKTASEIPGFTNGELVNETNDPKIWRKYVYLDFFKFSLINILIRETTATVNESSDDELAAKYVLAYFLGIGSYIEKASLLLSDSSSTQLKKFARELCDKIELYPEFPDLKYENYYPIYRQLFNYIQSNRKRNTTALELAVNFHNKRFETFDVCNKYYENYYYYTEYSKNTILKSLANFDRKPVGQLYQLYKQISTAEQVDVEGTKATLRLLRSIIDKKYNLENEFSGKFTVKNFLHKTSHPFFQGIMLEGKILSILFKAEYPEHGKNVTSIFQELVPFYAVNFINTGKLFEFNTELNENMPRLILAHHVYNANCDTIYNKMLVNKLLIWDSQKIIFNLSSSSSNVEIVLKERECCLETGFNHYRIHARQHLKAGNQNRAFFNAIDRNNREYYLTLDDDFFAFPDYALIGHKEIISGNLDYYQALNVYSGSYDLHTIGEKADAEAMQHFESSLGFCAPELFVLPRGSGTIFHFIDGKNSLSDTGGFLVDFSCEDFGQGFISLIQHESSVFGKAKDCLAKGKFSPNVHCIGEGVDLNGKMKQIERWNHGSAKVIFHMMIPVSFKCLLRGETNLLFNSQFFGTFFVFCSGIIQRLALFLLACVPFMISILTKTVNTNLSNHFNYHTLFYVVIVLAFLNSFFQIFNIQQRISTAPIRMVFYDYVINSQGLVGYIKGMLGIVPKTWRANKQRIYTQDLFLGNYLIVIINFFAVFISVNQHNTTENIVWAIFFIVTFGGGIIFLNSKRKPNDYLVNISMKVIKKIWLVILLLSAIASTTFFILEFQTHPDIYKISLLCLLVCLALYSHGYAILYMLLLHKQQKLGYE